MRAVRAGVGALPHLGAAVCGEVLGWGPRAGYVMSAGEVVVLAGPGVLPGPIHVELAEKLPPSPPRPLLLRRTGVKSWTGALPEPRALAAGLPLLAAVAAVAARRSALVDHPARGAWGDLVRCSDWEGLARAVGGLGPGLTPAGDDALAGAAFVARACLGPAVEDRLVAAVAGAPTNALSRAYTRWAAHGQALAPAHDLLGAAASDDVVSARRAAATLARVGHSSGADFCLGVTWVLSTDLAREVGVSA